MGTLKNTSLYQKNKRALIVLLVLLTGGIACAALLTFAKNDVHINAEVDTRPHVLSQPLPTINYQTQLNLAGIFKPAEKTDVAFELPGKVAWLNNKFKVGGIIKKGELLATLDPFNYQIKVSEKQADLALAQAHLSEELAQAEVAKKERAKHEHTPALALREPHVQSAQAQLKAAKAGLALAERNLSRTKYYAPYDALIMTRHIGLGQVTQIGESLGQIVNLTYGEVHVPIAGFDQPFLPALPIENIQISTSSSQRMGTLLRHVGRVNDVSKMTYYIVKVDDPYALHSNDTPLHFGQFVEVKLKGNTLHNVIKVQQEWIKNNTIWTVNSQQELVPFLAKIIRTEDEFALITPPARETIQVVTLLPEYPQAGMRVNTNINKTQLALKGE